jgi:hypothetical protein
MSRYNWFNVSVTCPTCGSTGEVDFQADIGILDWKTYSVGDVVIGPVASTGKRLHRGPGDDLDYFRENDFWAAGLAVCLSCKGDVWGRVEIRSGVFERVILSESELGPQDWGLCDKKLTPRPSRGHESTHA